jgi:ABC-type transport system involved in multi-copper enzyme maturation permease subunit
MRAIAPRLARLPTAAVRMFVGPIFQREVRALGRRRAPYWVRTGYTLLLLGIVSIVFFTIWETGGPGPGQQSVLEYLAPAMLATIATVQMAALALIAPVLTAGAIADEKRQRTLSTLLTTPLTSRDIILGKLGARTVQLIILALVPTPLLLALRVFGGVEAEAIVASVALSLAVGMLGATLALMFSIWHRRTPSVVFFALCATAVLVFLPWLGMMATEWSVAPNPDNIFFKCIAPIALVAVLAPEGMGGPSIADVREFWVSTLVYLGSISAGLVVFSIIVLRGVLKREAAGSANATLFTRLVAPGVEPTRTKPDDSARDARTIGDRPILWRELRQSAVGGLGRTLFGLGLGAAILLFLYAVAGPGNLGMTPALLFIALLGLVAQVALSTPASISSERDAGSWSVLLTTPVKPWQIVVGKTLGAIRRLWLIPAVAGMHLLVVLIGGWLHPLAVLHLAILSGGVVFMLASTGVCLGMVCRRGVTASVLNLAIPLTLFLGLPLFIGVLSEMALDDYELMEVLADIFMISNPFAMLTEAMVTATAEVERYQFYLRYQMLGSRGDVWATEFTMLALLCAGIQSAIGAVAMAIAIRGFNRWNGRPS